MIYKNSKGKDVGFYKDGAYYSRRKKSKHLMRKFNAWGIDDKIFQELMKEGCKEIRVLDEENNEVYSAKIQEFKGHRIYADFDGLQVFLPLDYWTKEKPKYA